MGYGSDARTTLESTSRFRRLNPDLKILGVEIDQERVENALPKNLSHRVVPGEPIFDFFAAWKAAAAETTAMKTYEVKQWFIAAAERLGERGCAVMTQRKWLNRGFLIWRLELS